MAVESGVRPSRGVEHGKNVATVDRDGLNVGGASPLAFVFNPEEGADYRAQLVARFNVRVSASRPEAGGRWALHGRRRHWFKVVSAGPFLKSAEHGLELARLRCRCVFYARWDLVVRLPREQPCVDKTTETVR